MNPNKEMLLNFSVPLKPTSLQGQANRIPSVFSMVQSTCDSKVYLYYLFLGGLCSQNLLKLKSLANHFDFSRKESSFPIFQNGAPQTPSPGAHSLNLFQNHFHEQSRATIWHEQRERSTLSPSRVCKRVYMWNFPMNASGRLPKKTTVGWLFSSPKRYHCSLSLLLRKDWLLPVH